MRVGGSSARNLGTLREGVKRFFEGRTPGALVLGLPHRLMRTAFDERRSTHAPVEPRAPHFAVQDVNPADLWNLLGLEPGVPDLLARWLAEACGVQLGRIPTDAREETFAELRKGVKRRAELGEDLHNIALDRQGMKATAKILYEDSKAIVILNRRGTTTALVLPKQEACYPLDLANPQADMQHLARLAEAVRCAYQEVLGSTHSSIWINPPSALTQGHLHIHVAAQGTRDAPELNSPEVDALLGRLNTAIARQLEAAPDDVAQEVVIGRP
jgi:diadenosine tetraphosphate (Ap4A) HIT family hydrolase